MINELKPVSISDKLVGSGTNLQDASVDVLNANIVLITLRIEEIPNLFFHIIVHISLAHRGTPLAIDNWLILFMKLANSFMSSTPSSF